MSKVKYYYDSENLAYKKIITKTRNKVGVFLLFIVSSALFGFLSVVLLLNVSYFETPKNRKQAREIENLKLRYEILNQKLNQIEEVTNNISERDNNLYRVYFNAAQTTTKEIKTNYKNANQYKELEGFNNSQLVINTTKRIDHLRKELAQQSKSLDEILNMAKSKDKLLAAIPAIQPIKNENLKKMVSGFGYRTDPFTKVRKIHNGMDFAAKTGTPIYATGDGLVIRADNTASGYGNHIVIKHGYGYETLFAHLSKYNCKSGQKVKRGDVIGYVGSTGRSEGPHLHYEVHQNGKIVNPLNFYYGDISGAEYVAISQSANQENQSFD